MRGQVRNLKYADIIYNNRKIKVKQADTFEERQLGNLDNEQKK